MARKTLEFYMNGSTLEVRSVTTPGEVLNSVDISCIQMDSPEDKEDWIEGWQEGYKAASGIPTDPPAYKEKWLEGWKAGYRAALDSKNWAGK